jgi:hypothetical protein
VALKVFAALALKLTIVGLDPGVAFTIRDLTLDWSEI